MDSITITRTEEIDYLQFKRLLEHQDKLTHAITLKTHNAGFNLLKDVEIRETSIEKLSREFGIAKENFIQSHQTHSRNILELNSYEEFERINNNKITNKEINCGKNSMSRFSGKIVENYDGFIANTSNIASIITFADCVPIFIYDPKHNVYANIHSGWRGVVNQISLKAIQKLIKEYGSNPTDLICCIGPNIRKECFLVNHDLVEIYSSTFADIVKHKPIIEETDLCNEKGRQYKIDNNLLLKELFKSAGIIEKNIIDSGMCTVCRQDEFHSRRAEGENFQKNGGLMMCK